LCKQGHIIHLLDAETPGQSHPYFAYTWTKRTLKLLSQMLAVELAPDIRVNAVSPGLVLPSGRFTEADFERMAKRVPLQKRGDQRDVVNAVLFLIENPNITGVCLDVDGGAHLGSVDPL
jgi:NAD(P)-dependent dehydrogenase (short-subunit alcohol dehydrogenase family)